MAEPVRPLDPGHKNEAAGIDDDIAETPNNYFRGLVGVCTCVLIDDDEIERRNMPVDICLTENYLTL